MKGLFVAAVLAAVSFSTPSHAFFMPSGAMFSGGFDYLSQSIDGTVRTAATNPSSIHAVKARLFSVGDDNLSDAD